MEHFGTSTQRIQQYRSALLNIEPAVCTERAVLATRAYKAHEMDQIVLKRAYMLKEVLENMSIYIEPETRIVGNQASENRAAPIFPEYAMDWVIRELDDFDKRTGERFTISEENKQVLRDIYPYWKGRTLQDKAYAAYPEKARRIYDLGIIRNEGNITSGDAHLAVDYDALLKKGLKDVRRRTQEALDGLNLADYESMKRSFFYRAILIVIDAVECYAHRFADLAEQQAQTATAERAAELMEISRICRKVPMEPAHSFHEALQSVWFIHVILQIESNGHSLSFGRFDQFCYPYYMNSLNEGADPADLEELLENLWLKSLTVSKIRSAGHSRFQAGNPMYQNVTIGGQTTDKKDAVNELSFVVLQSVAQTRLTQPNLTVRYHKNLDPKFFDECIEVMRLGFGMPALNNDEIIIPSFIGWGVSEEDAYNYSAIGCVETAVPGKWGYRCTGMSYINFPRLLLCVMNDGVDMTSGKRFVKGYGFFKDMASYDELMAAWDKSLREMTRYSVIVENFIDKASERDVPDVLCSALTDDCIARGRTIKEGGAVYDFISGLQVGIANMADCLSAIKKLVYDEKRITREQLWNAILDDFQSPENQEIQRMLIEDAPKYGNDDDAVDQLVVDAYAPYIDEIKKYPNTRHLRGPIGGIRYAGTSSISANVGQGMGTKATPDGRNAFEPLAEGCSPAHNADKHGPTAVFKSVAKLPTDKITGGVLLNQKMTPQMLSTAENRQKLEMLIRTFFNTLHGYHVQYNIVSRDTLIDAQLHPEDHKDLIVRVAGYSAFFNVLSKKTQDDIIERTEQTL